MSEEWRSMSLSEVFALDNARLGPHTNEPQVLSLSKYKGFVRSDEYFDKRIASANLDAYKIIVEDGWAYSTIHIDEGSIARNTLGFPGVISPMYTTLRWISEDHEPAFFELLLRSPEMLAKYQDNAQGSINRRRSLPFKSFAALTVEAPPLPIQRRIVDLMAHLDFHLANLRAEREALSVTLTSACLLMTTPHEGDEHASIPEVAEILDRLRVPISEDERVHRSGNVPYYGANGQVGWIDESIFDEPLVLVAEDGGPVAEWRTRPQAYAIDGPAWVNNHAHVLRATRVSRDWLYYSLRHRDLTALAPVGTRSKLTQASLRSITVSLPHDSMNRGRLLREIETTLDSLSREVLTVESARAQLLVGLLRGHFVIPESYDTLLSEVV